QGKVQIWYAAPPRIRMDCYFSNASMQDYTRLTPGQWHHVLFSYVNGDARLYLNGTLVQVNDRRGPPLNIRRPARFYLGGWYNRYGYQGDIDEVRISNVARSRDWAKLQFENQKPLQTLVGHLVQPGTTFSVSPKTLVLNEGENASVKATAGGAEKLYWVFEDSGVRAIEAVDRLHHRFDAFRVSGDKAFSLVLQAVYPDGIRRQEIPVTIRESLPDPDFHLTAPTTWDGRKPIEVTPVIANLEAMKAKGVADLEFDWNVSGLAVTRRTAGNSLLLERAQNSGTLTVRLTLDNGGRRISSSLNIEVREPEHDPWVYRQPAPDEKPVNNQFYARDESGLGTLTYNGILKTPADAVFLNLYADGKRLTREVQKPAIGEAYGFSMKLKPGLVRYKVEFGHGGTVIHTVT
ncbi:MAG: LamG domain-containing protein, partial [Verrucomicrobiota bacterium]